MTDSHDNDPNRGIEEPLFEAPEQVEGTTDAQEPTTSFEDFEILREKASQAFRAGAAEAKEALINRFPQVKDDVSRSVGDAAYAIGYALSFGSTLIREFSNETILDGFERGSEAGQSAAKQTFDQRQTQKSDESPAPTEDKHDPSAEG